MRGSDHLIMSIVSHVLHLLLCNNVRMPRPWMRLIEYHNNLCLLPADMEYQPLIMSAVRPQQVEIQGHGFELVPPLFTAQPTLIQDGVDASELFRHSFE